ncbi:MAG: VIT domain-containing protein [bacterium]
MKKILVLAFVVLTTISLFAQDPNSENVSGSPYLMIIKEIPTKADVELTITDVDVNISGVIADVTVRQYYRSTSDQVLEAVYVFPASVHAAVYSMKMKIGSREIVAVIKEKEQARKDYEQAKLEGKRASLLVQDRPNLFQMNLANIAPGDLISIEMKYTEVLVPDDKIYTFSFPTIVAPRYGGEINSEVMDEKNANNPQDKRYVSNSIFDIRFNLISPVPIDGIECITHDVNYGGETANHSQITLKDSEKKGAPKDFVVKYKLAGDLINSGLLLSRGEGKDAENFFLLTVQPPKRIDPAYIPPREYVFVLDVSGSMNGFPSVMAKKTILNLLDKLDKDDKLNLILFASGFDVFSENLVTANRDNLEKAFKFMAESRQGGGTELLPALEKALKMPKDSKASRSVVVITDGLIDFESKAFELIRNNLNKANVFAFGIGTSMNKLTIEGIARAGNGLYFEANRLDDAEYQSERFVKYIATPILTDIKVTYDGFGVSEVEPMSVPDLFPDRPIIIYGKWDGNLQGGIKIEAINGQEKISVELPITKFGEMVEGDALKQLWARKQIELLSDYQSFGERDKYKKEITDLGLKYSLMTAYTSFIAVDNEIVPNYGRLTKDQNQLGTGGVNLKLQASPEMRLGENMRAVSIASAEGGSGIDVGGFSGSIDYAKATTDDKTSKSLTTNIQYDEKELYRNIKYTQKALNAALEGSVSMKVTVDKKGKVVKITPLVSTDKLLTEIASNAIKATKFIPATKDGKAFQSTIDVYMNIELPNSNFKMKFQGKTYEMLKGQSGSSKYWFAILQYSNKAKIEFLSKVRFECRIYSEKQELIKTDTLSVILGIGETAAPIEEALQSMWKGDEKLLLFDKQLLNTGIKPNTQGIPYTRKVFVKIKVLDATGGVIDNERI